MPGDGPGAVCGVSAVDGAALLSGLVMELVPLSTFIVGTGDQVDEVGAEAMWFI